MIERKIVVSDSGIVDFVREDGSVCHPHGMIRLAETPKDILDKAARILAKALDAHIIERLLTLI